MAGPTTKSTHGDRFDSTQAGASLPSRLSGAALQLGLASILLLSLWQLLGPEPETIPDHRLRTGLVGFAGGLTVSLWILTSQWPIIAKMSMVIACLIAILAFGVESTREFDASCRVLEPALLKQGRIVHEAIGLSYVALPNLIVQTQPAFKQDPANSKKHNPQKPTRLCLGDVAAFRHILQVNQPDKSDRSPTMIVLEIQNNPFYDTAHLIRFVRTNEEKMAKSAEMQIVKSTRQVPIAGFEMVEYELVKKPRNIMARTVYLRAGKFLLNFMLLTENEADRALFDDLLNSIRLER